MNEDYKKLLEYQRNYYENTKSLLLDGKKVNNILDVSDNSMAIIVDVIREYLSEFNPSKLDYEILKQIKESYNNEYHKYDIHTISTSLANYNRLKGQIVNCIYTYCNESAYYSGHPQGDVSLKKVMSYHEPHHYSYIEYHDGYYTIRNGKAIDEEDYQKKLTLFK